MAHPRSSARAGVESTLPSGRRRRWAQVHRPLGVRPKAVRGRKRRYECAGGHLDTDVISAPRHDPRALGAVPAAASADGLDLGLNGCPAGTDRAPVCALARQGLRPDPARWTLQKLTVARRSSRQRAFHGSRRGPSTQAAYPRQFGDDAASACSIRRCALRANGSAVLLSLMSVSILFYPPGWRRHAPAGRERRRQGLGASLPTLVDRQPPRCGGGKAIGRFRFRHAHRPRREVASTTCTSTPMTVVGTSRFPSSSPRLRHTDAAVGTCGAQRARPPVRPRWRPQQLVTRRSRPVRVVLSQGSRPGAHHDLAAAPRLQGRRPRRRTPRRCAPRRSGGPRPRAAGWRARPPRARAGRVMSSWKGTPRGRTGTRRRRARSGAQAVRRWPAHVVDRRAPWAGAARASGTQQHRSTIGYPGSGCSAPLRVPSASIRPRDAVPSPPAGGRCAAPTSRIGAASNRTAQVTVSREQAPRCSPRRSQICASRTMTSAPRQFAIAGNSSLDPESATSGWCPRRRRSRTEQQQTSSGPSQCRTV